MEFESVTQWQSPAQTPIIQKVNVVPSLLVCPETIVYWL
jgi:hypothetical protein